jgi:hypothetical protein
VINRCFRETLELFQRAAEGKRGEAALEAMGDAYVNQLLPDRTRLLGQMQAYAACEDPDIRAVVRAGYGDLFSYVDRVSGLPARQITQFFAAGMLLNVIACMDLAESTEPWATRLLEGCRPE